MSDEPEATPYLKFSYTETVTMSVEVPADDARRAMGLGGTRDAKLADRIAAISRSDFQSVLELCQSWGNYEGTEDITLGKIELVMVPIRTQPPQLSEKKGQTPTG